MRLIYVKRITALILSACVLLAAAACAPVSAPAAETPAPTQEPTPSPTPTPEPTPEPTPTPEPELIEFAPELITGEYTRLINIEHQLDPEYEPEGMVNVRELDTEKLLTYKRSDFVGDATAVSAMLDMIAAAAEDGLTGYYLASVYRSYSAQKSAWNKKVRENKNYGKDGEPLITAAAGASEHQSGLAFDIVCNSHRSRNAAFGDTEHGLWLREHCAEYGFILRYERGKEEITGIKYEPWHFRYVGAELAEYVTENGLALEEFYRDAE